MIDDDGEIAGWIDANLTATSYTKGRRAIIITVGDETDWLMLKLRWL